MRLKRVGVLSLARVLAVGGLLYGAFVGLIYGNLFGFSGLTLYFMGGGASQSEALAWQGAVVGGCLLLFAVLGLFFGFLHGIVFGLFGNLVLRLTGGLALELDQPLGDSPVARTD